MHLILQWSPLCLIVPKQFITLLLQLFCSFKFIDFFFLHSVQNNSHKSSMLYSQQFTNNMYGTNICSKGQWAWLSTSCMWNDAEGSWSILWTVAGLMCILVHTYIHTWVYYTVSATKWLHCLCDEGTSKSWQFSIFSASCLSSSSVWAVLSLTALSSSCLLRASLSRSPCIGREADD